MQPTTLFSLSRSVSQFISIVYVNHSENAIQLIDDLRQKKNNTVSSLSLTPLQNGNNIEQLNKTTHIRKYFLH